VNLLPKPAWLGPPAVTALACISVLATAQDGRPSADSLPPPAPQLPIIVVEGKAESLLGIAPSATKGQTSRDELLARPFSRRGELLESIPGVIITQHAGDGKANQYFVRGANLDHGTDFAVFVDGMQVNLRNHAHGQGYADLNFIIPELVERLDYWKGNYFAQFGDMSSTGAARFSIVDRLQQGIAHFNWGEFNFYRGLLADTIQAGAGSLTAALEYTFYDGPWDLAQGSERWNGLLKYHWGDDRDSIGLTLMGYRAEWTSTDQIPARAVEAGRLGRFGFIDPTNGGDSQRYSLSATWERVEDRFSALSEVYGGFYDLDLYSNFTYFLEYPDKGDQFRQAERRWFAGLNETLGWTFDAGGREHRLTAGFQTRHDWASDSGLHWTSARRVHETVRVDDIYQGVFSLFADLEWRFTDWLRVTPGLRGDLFHSQVSSRDLAANSGSSTDAIASPKLGVVFGPWADTEFYLNGGLGFHSNDARGITIRRDPATGERVDAVDPLVRTYGAEAGVRNESVPGLVNTLGLWVLKSDSELIYAGDAGNTEPGPASLKYGIEASSYWRPAEWLTLDVEATATYAELRDTPEGRFIPGAVPYTLNTGLNLGKSEGLFASVRGRFFGPRPLTEDGTVQSRESIQINARAGYRLRNWELALECFNLLNRADNDIEYFYESRLRGEPAAGRGDRHFHPIEPRMFRLALTCRW
jgi:outer membrane receptor for Fe3+-dicitrate